MSSVTRSWHATPDYMHLTLSDNGVELVQMFCTHANRTLAGCVALLTQRAGRPLPAWMLRDAAKGFPAREH